MLLCSMHIYCCASRIDGVHFVIKQIYKYTPDFVNYMLNNIFNALGVISIAFKHSRGDYNFYRVNKFTEVPTA